MPADQAPLQQIMEALLPGVATAGNDDSITLGVCQFAGVVSSVTYVPDTAITGQNTNTRAIRVRNRGTAGTGTTIVAEKQFDTGTNAAQFDETPITLSATPANLVVAAGDVLEAFSDAVLTGMADPGGKIRVVIDRSA